MSEQVQETGVVSFVKGDYAYLKTETASACGSCASKDSCGSRHLNFTPSDYSIRVLNKSDLKEGDEVIIGMSSDKLLLGTLLVYLLPLLFLFLFAYIGKTLGGELVSAIAGLMGLFISLAVVRKIISRKSIACQFEPEVTQKI